MIIEEVFEIFESGFRKILLCLYLEIKRALAIVAQWL